MRAPATPARPTDSLRRHDCIGIPSHDIERRQRVLAENVIHPAQGRYRLNLDHLESTAPRIADDGCGMMARCAAKTGVPGCDERARAPATAADERSGQGRRDPRPAPPDRGAAKPAGRSEAAFRPKCSGVAGGAAPPTAYG